MYKLAHLTVSSGGDVQIGALDSTEVKAEMYKLAHLTLSKVGDVYIGAFNSKLRPGRSHFGALESK